MSLSALLVTVREHSGIAAKSDIQLLQRGFLQSGGPDFYPNGDDATALCNNDGYDLFAMEGFINEFVEHDPWFAGWCGVMVNISDIAAMGGHPVGVLNALWANGSDDASELVQGMVAASQAFDVPILGGHSNLRSRLQLAVAIIGRAKHLLSSFAAEPGQVLVAAIDLRGRYRRPFLNWDAATSAPAARLRGDIALLPTIAERRLASAAKDISQAGLLGTSLMLAESAGVGADIHLSKIPCPDTVSWQDWLCTFPSFGYLLTTHEHTLDALLECFKHRGIAASAIGTITGSPRVWVSHEQQRELFWDLAKQPLIGLSASITQST